MHATENDRTLAYLRHVSAAAEQGAWVGASPFLELAKLELARRGEDAPPLHRPNITQSIAHINARKDCGDFAWAGLWRMVYRYPGALPADLLPAIDDAALGFIWWLDEPGEEHCCFSSENHQILYHSAELLAAQRHPDAVFRNNGETGHWHRAHAETGIRRWLSWRARFDFTEWLSHCYYDEDLVALLNLRDFADAADIRRDADALVSLILLQVAMHSHRGVMGCTHGRTYSRYLLHPAQESVSPVAHLAWGRGNGELVSIGAVALAASDYVMPEVIGAIALDDPAELETRARHGVNAEDAARWNLHPDSADDFLYFAAGQSRHRAVIDTALRYVPAKHGNMAWGVQYAHDYYHRCEAQGVPYDPNQSEHTLAQADLYTFRTPHAMLSCAQDYRKGQPGYQQHIWQATLGGEAVVFTTNPGPGDRPDRWAGNGILPKAVAYRNVLVCLYRILPRPQMGMQPLPYLPYTHAWFPTAALDEVVEEAGWVFGRKDDGYVALRSLITPRWNDDGPRTELIADGPCHAWVCEIGDPRLHGTFAGFVAAIAAAPLNGDDRLLGYVSPTVGTVEVGWDTPLRVNGVEIAIRDYPRLHNRYTHVAFGETTFALRCGAAAQTLELAGGKNS